MAKKARIYGADLIKEALLNSDDVTFRMEDGKVIQLKVDEINRAVMDKVAKRADTGMRTYGKPMTREDVSTLEWLNHLQEELLDGAVYLERLKRDLTKLGVN